jgi:FtsP/CotA-like multicopper oxidase with cupredoxin domain
LSGGQNAAADFFFFTEVPIAAHFTGVITNDLGNEFDPNSPNFGEKWAAPFVPIAIRDYLGREVTRVYSDQWGIYNGIVPSTYTTNIGNPSGMSPGMYSVCINDPGPIEAPFVPDDFFRSEFTQNCYTFMFMPGTTTYLDTPILPISAFASQEAFPLDCEFPNGTPVIDSVVGSGPDAGGAYAVQGQEITITSVGLGPDHLTSVRDPEYNPFSDPPSGSATEDRDYGFGADTGSVKLGDVSLVVDGGDWTNTSITATVPAGTDPGQYQLMVTRGDNGESTVVGLTVTVGHATDGYIDGAAIHVPNGGSIQDAIDGAASGDLILVHPGTYEELVVLWKPVRLQGSGRGTLINAIKRPSAKLDAWRNKVEELVQAGSVDLLPGQDAQSPLFGSAGLFSTEQGPGILVLAEIGAFLQNPNARIDGFTITGADSGGGILVNGYADFLEISNNRIISNQGNFGGGIRVGHPVTPSGFTEPAEADNDNISIHHNQIAQNGSTTAGGAGGGGIALFNDSNSYEVTDNYICGNFTTGSGGGIGHYGLSNGEDESLIKGNSILFNQSFHQQVLNASGGGISIEGIIPAGGGLTRGSGSVTIDSNLIQGNYAGAGDGGGIRLAFVNGQDVDAAPVDPASWHEIIIDTNTIVNNFSGLAGAGISMQDAANVDIRNNTIAHNDSTATAGEAFTGIRQGLSVRQPSGIVSRGHSAELINAIGEGTDPEFSDFSDPILARNIIWQNRSFHFDILVNFPLGGFVPEPFADGTVPDANYWDLGVLGAAGQLHPVCSLLTLLTGTPDGATYDTAGDGNVGSDSLPPADPGFDTAYFNISATAVGVEDRGTQLDAALALDEGGNFIDVRYSPLTPTGDYNFAFDIGGLDCPLGILGGESSTPAGTSAGGTTSSTIGSASSGSSGGCFITTASSGWSAPFGLCIVLGVLATMGVTILVSRERPSKRGLAVKRISLYSISLVAALLMALMPVTQATAGVVVQCPADTDGIDTDGDGIVDNDNVCMHLAAGDGFINMADGKLQYIFSFADVTPVPVDDVMMAGMLAANFSAPTIKVKEGQKLYLTLTNVGMMIRPDLFDPHTVHYHGFPNAASIFDGVPDNSISINMGSSLTYFYYNAEPGTYLYHCHVEATEHMQMGMLGNLYVTPKQDGTPYTDPDGSGRVYTKFAYNDGDGSTGYNRDYPIQISAFDPDFHDASLFVQPLPFALMVDKYPMLNGRGYPDTVNTAELENTAGTDGYADANHFSQKIHSLITATQGEKILLRISSLSTTSYHTLTVLGIPMKVVGMGARLLRGPDGKNLFYETNSVDLGGGEAIDVILDTAQVAPGTYFLYTTNLDHLSNHNEDFGGMMTEIVVAAP